jgi:hypothetical protein
VDHKRDNRHENIQSHHGAFLAFSWNYHHHYGNSYVPERKFQQLGCLLCFWFDGIGNLFHETLYAKENGKTPGFFEQSEREITVQTQTLGFHMISS